MKVTFFRNLCDEHGDVFDDGVFLCCGKEERTIIKFDNVIEMKEFAKTILYDIITEMKENNLLTEEEIEELDA